MFSWFVPESNQTFSGRQSQLVGEVCIPLHGLNISDVSRYPVITIAKKINSRNPHSMMFYCKDAGTVCEFVGGGDETIIGRVPYSEEGDFYSELRDIVQRFQLPHEEIFSGDICLLNDGNCPIASYFVLPSRSYLQKLIQS